MHWRWADNRDQALILIDSTEHERASAERGIADLRMEAGAHGETTGGRLQRALDSGRLPWEVVKSLSSWCNSEGKYGPGVKPAQVVSRAFFNGRILPRLTEFRGDGLTNENARQLFAGFAETAKIWVDRTPVQERLGGQHVPEEAEHATEQAEPLVTYKRRPISGYRLLVGTYSDKDLASPYRSTVPLLAYWSALERRLPDFAAALGIDLPDPEVFAFEYTVPVQEGAGNDSHTDLMLLLHSQSIAIEAKYTEPPYPIVRKWLGSPSERNRVSVLTGWLSLINGATGADLKVADVLDCTYQMVHRTASACEPSKQGRAVIYQCFDPTQAQLNDYYMQLARLSRLVDRPERLRFFLLAIGLRKSMKYQRLQDAWRVGNRDLSVEVRQGLVSESLLDFEILSARRV